MSARIAASRSRQLGRHLSSQAGPACRSSSMASATSIRVGAQQQQQQQQQPCALRSARRLVSNLSHARSYSSPAMTPTNEAFDLSVLESQILKAVERLTHDLAELRAGGRFNPENLEKLRVMLKPGGGAPGGKETHRLGDLAQVIPKGRVISVVADGKDHIKPLMTAIQASPYSLTPQPPKPDNPTTITVPIPPPTGESRMAALDAAKKAETNAAQAVQKARAAHHKKLRALQLGRSVRPDDVNKATKLMDETVKKGAGEVKRIADAARKVLESA